MRRRNAAQYAVFPGACTIASDTRGSSPPSQGREQGLAIVKLALANIGAELTERVPFPSQIAGLRPHDQEQHFGRRGRGACPLRYLDLALPGADLPAAGDIVFEPTEVS